MAPEAKLEKASKEQTCQAEEQLEKQQLEETRTETRQFGFSKTEEILVLLISCSFAIVELATREFSAQA